MLNWLGFALLAVVLGSAREVMQKKALQREHTLEYLVIRGFFITIISLFLLPFVNLNISWPGYLAAMLGAIIACVGILHRNKAVKHIEISHVEPLMNTQPLFVLIIAFVFLGEAVTIVQLGGILLLALGTYILEVNPEHQGLFGPFKHLMKSKYPLMVLFSTFLFGIANTIDRFALTTYTNSLTWLVVVWFFINAFLFLYHTFKYRLKNIGTVFKKHGKEIFWPALFGVGMILSLYQAMSMAYVSMVIAVYRLESLVVTIHGGRFFHEDNLKQKSLACTVMVIGAILVVV